MGRRHALRALLSGAAAAVGAAVLGATRPKEASADVTGNFTSSTTTPAVTATNSDGGFGVQGSSTGFNAGIGGFASGGGASGVYGESSSTTGIGVYGSNTASGGIGVYGKTASSDNAGVYGENLGSGPAILGHNTGAGPGIIGSNSTTAQAAILGSNAGGGPAVVGFATGSGALALGGASDNGYGFFGGATGAGIGALVQSGTGTALWAQQTGSPAAGTYAGLFQGPVLITGSSTVMGAKSAAVKGADGSLRRLYSLECPESWFEDFGSAQLSGGSATVQLAADFTAVVRNDEYHIFLTPKGEPKGPLYVGSQTPAGFTVREAGGGTSSIAFSYRVVAKRKDIAGARMEHVDEPKLPALPTLPKAPAPPPVPTLPERPSAPLTPGAQGH